MTIYTYLALVGLWLSRHYSELSDNLLYLKNYYFFNF